MLDITVIGVGNAGNQVAALANEKLNIETIAINSSEKDLQTVPDKVIKLSLSNPEGTSKGAAKDRAKAKEYLRDSVVTILDEDIRTMLSTKDVIFVVSSTGGGTGSGAAPILSEILTSMLPGTIIIVVGILPVIGESLSAHVNSLQYLDEIFKQVTNLKYMLYDNDHFAGIPSYKMMQRINEEIVNDIDILRCTYNYPTPYDSIDEADMKRLLNFNGRIMVARLDDIKDRDVENKGIPQMLLSVIKNNCHAELSRDKKIVASGLISNLTESMIEDFDNHIPEICEYMGSPDHDFTHTCVTPERKLRNCVFYIASGLSTPEDKITIISDRIAEIEEKQAIQEEENTIGNVDINSLVGKIAAKDNKPNTESATVDLAGIFGRFNI